MSNVIEDIQEVKSDDKKDIEMEEREKMLNAENKAQEEKPAEAGDSIEEKKKEIKEGMEVKPKKIPIGGIQMPGFFTRSKSKEKCKVISFCIKKFHKCRPHLWRINLNLYLAPYGLQQNL